MPNWGQILEEINNTTGYGYGIAKSATDIVRRKYLASLHQHTKRNIIAYYSGFLSKPNASLSDINDEDKNGFMAAIHNLDRSLGLDLIIHTPGGSIAATQSIVNYLHQMFGHNIRAFVPQIAMSAGTMLACSCEKIIMTKHSNLGPIDPHLDGMPAYGVKHEFERACREVEEHSSKIDIWAQIIGQYRPAFLSQCENAIEWSNMFVTEQLTNVMFAGQDDATEKAEHIVDKLTDFSGNKTHERHIHYEECKEMGLNVDLLEDMDKQESRNAQELGIQDLVVTVHHCFMHTLMNTPAYKIIENHNGIAMVKNTNVV